MDDLSFEIESFPGFCATDSMVIEKTFTDYAQIGLYNRPMEPGDYFKLYKSVTILTGSPKLQDFLNRGYKLCYTWITKDKARLVTRPPGTQIFKSGIISLGDSIDLYKPFIISVDGVDYIGLELL